MIDAVDALKPDKVNDIVLSQVIELASTDHFFNKTHFKRQNFSTVIALSGSFDAMKRLDLLCRRSGHTKLVAARTFGSCGYVFNDFLPGFTVTDVDGEVYKEVQCIVLLLMRWMNADIVSCIDVLGTIGQQS